VGAAALIDWAVAAHALPGETESGDLHFVKANEAGALVSVVDGLGHGGEAAVAARAAVAALDRFSDEAPLSLVARCHQALAGTRGVVMSVASFDRAGRTMTWLGVGNVEGVLLYSDPGSRRGRTTLVAPGGIVGSAMPRLRAEVISIVPGDLLIFASDGIRGGFAEDLPAEATPQQLADDILARSSKGTDDALALVVRYVGGARNSR